MPPSVIDIEDQDSSDDDSDFAPDDDAAGVGGAAAADDDDDSDDSYDAASPPCADGDENATRKRPLEAIDAGLENSGDEAIITKGRKRRRRGKPAAAAGGVEHHDDHDVDDDGDDGSRIKTRRMRAAEKAEKKRQPNLGRGATSTIDVDALWAAMMGGETTAPADSGPAEQQSGDAAPVEGDADADPDHTLVRIRRTYNFAGKVHTEEKLVPRSSAEARLHLASAVPGAAPPADGEGGETDAQPRRPPPRRAFRSVYEPVSDSGAAGAGGRRTDLDLGVRARQAAAAASGKAPPRLNTVEKSRLDWAGFIDREGIKDELELAGRAKGSYAGREGFLARSEARREEDARRMRTAGRAGAG